MKFKNYYFISFILFAFVGCSKPYMAIVYDGLGSSTIVDREKSSIILDYREYFDYVIEHNDCKLFRVFDDRIYVANADIGNKIIRNCLISHVKTHNLEAYRDFLSYLGFNCSYISNQLKCEFIGAYESGRYTNLFYLIPIPEEGVKGPMAGKAHVRILVIVNDMLDVSYYNLSV